MACKSASSGSSRIRVFDYGQKGSLQRGQPSRVRSIWIPKWFVGAVDLDDRPVFATDTLSDDLYDHFDKTAQHGHPLCRFNANFPGVLDEKTNDTRSNNAFGL